MRIHEIIAFLEEIAPPPVQESYDNSGLILGDVNAETEGVLLSLDCTEEVVDEAISKGLSLIVSHHPIVFSGLKSLTGRNYVERTILKAIKNDIALYAIHTNLDNVPIGVNHKIGEKMGLNNLRILSPKMEMLTKLVVFVPKDSAEKVKNAIFSAGGGSIGKYDECSFSSSGEGTFRAGEGTDPHIGEIGVRHAEPELRIEVLIPEYLGKKVVSAMKSAHPYEEVAYDLYSLQNEHRYLGSGMVGELTESIPLPQFLQNLKDTFNVPCIRYTNSRHSKVSKVAYCGGSGSFLLAEAKASGAEVFVTGDFKYHQFFDGEEEISIVDIGHYESEQFTTELLGEKIKGKFPKFAVHFTEVNTNPVNYF